MLLPFQMPKFWGFPKLSDSPSTTELFRLGHWGFVLGWDILPCFKTCKLMHWFIHSNTFYVLHFSLKYRKFHWQSVLRVYIWFKQNTWNIWVASKKPIKCLVYKRICHNALKVFLIDILSAFLVTFIAFLDIVKTP